MNRSAVLGAADSAINGQRDQVYGTPENNFGRIADYWSTYLENRTHPNLKIAPHEVAEMLILMKIARLQNDPEHADSWIDIAGYAACGGEVADA